MWRVGGGARPPFLVQVPEGAREHSPPGKPLHTEQPQYDCTTDAKT